LMGSAYAGETGSTFHPATARASSGWPGATLMGTAYDGGAYRSKHPLVQSSSPALPKRTVPIRGTGSAYDGQ
jgi:hypothetical protein